MERPTEYRQDVTRTFTARLSSPQLQAAGLRLLVVVLLLASLIEIWLSADPTATGWAGRAGPRR